MDRAFFVARIGDLLDELRRTKPLVQAITNLVSMDATANALLAIGAAPAMVHSPDESAEFVERADALVVNIGTLSRLWLDGGEAAATAARMHGRPWVLDPVGVGATRFRNEAVVRLLRHRPSVIRGNASEIIAVARVAGISKTDGAPRGAETTNHVEEALEAARHLARHCFCVVAATGPFDVITDGRQVVRIGNGHPLMGRVTALGCALSAIVATFNAIEPDPFVATIAALGVYGIAGDMAAESATRPGSFRVAFIDALDTIDRRQLAARLKVIA